MLRLRLLAWSGVRSGVQHGTSGVRCGAQRAQSGVRCGAQVQLPAQVQVQLPAQLPGRNSNSTGSAKSLIEPAAQPPRTETADVAARRFLLLSFLTSAILHDPANETRASPSVGLAQHDLRALCPPSRRVATAAAAPPPYPTLRP